MGVDLPDGPAVAQLSPAQEQLVLDHLHIADRCAQEVRRDVGADFDDDRQNAVLGLLTAARSFDSTKDGATFGPYAVRSCRWAISKGRMRSRGISYRQAVYRGELYRDPFSIHHSLRPDDPTIADQLVEPAPDVHAPDPRVNELLALMSHREKVAVLHPIADACEILGITRAGVRKVRTRTYARLRKVVAA